MEPDDGFDQGDEMGDGEVTDVGDFPGEPDEATDDDSFDPDDATSESPAESLPGITVGSELRLEGQSLGSKKGAVRLRVMGIGMPVSILSWSDQVAMIRVPKLELAKPVKATLDVTRADGTLVSRSPIKLTPSSGGFALRQ
jgi:hypothetical protein